MRMKRTLTEPTPAPVNAAQKISKVIVDFFLPMATVTMPGLTSFAATSDAEEIWALEQLVQLFPEDRRHKSAILQQVDTLCDKCLACRL